MARKTDTRIRFGVFDVGAKEEAVYSGSGLQPFADYEILREDGRIAPRYATLELNQWLLNGESSAPPNDLNSGDWNILSLHASDKSRMLTRPPVLRATFDEPHTSAGLTLIGDENTQTWCEEVHIAWLGETGNLLYEADYRPNAVTYYIDNLVSNYYAIEITMVKTNKPHVFAVLSGLDYGLQHIFDESELQSAEIVEEFSPVAECLMIGELNFTALSRDEAFNVLNPEGIFSALQTGQTMIVESTVNDELKTLGRYYLNDWDEKDGIKISFKCVDAIGMMEDDECQGGLFTNRSVSSIIQTLFDGKGYQFRIANDVKGILLSGWIPYTSCREALQMVVFAAGAIALVNRDDGVVEIKNLSTATKATLRNDRRIIGQTVTRRKLVSNSEVTAFAFTLGSEIKEVWKEEREPGTYIVTFTNPSTSLSVTGATIVNSGVNHATIDVRQFGEIVITGREYTSKKSLFREAGSNFLMNGFRNTVQADSNAMISPSTAQLVAQRLIGFYSRGMSMSFRSPLENERLGDYIRVFAANNILVNGTVTKIIIQLVGLLADFEMVGDAQSITAYDDFRRVSTFYSGGNGL